MVLLLSQVQVTCSLSHMLSVHYIAFLNPSLVTPSSSVTFLSLTRSSGIFCVACHCILICNILGLVTCPNYNVSMQGMDVPLEKKNIFWVEMARCDAGHLQGVGRRLPNERQGLASVHQSRESLPVAESTLQRQYDLATVRTTNDL